MTRLLALDNAELTAVNAGGLPADYDRPATAGASKWAGSERVFWAEDNARERGVGSSGRSSGSLASATDQVVTRSLVVDGTLDVAWEIGDVVTVTRDAVGAASGVVQRVARSGEPEAGIIVRLTLEDA